LAIPPAANKNIVNLRLGNAHKIFQSPKTCEH